MLYHHDPHQWTWSQGHRLWNFKLKFLVKVFGSLYLLKFKLDHVDTLPDVRYWSEVLCCTNITPHQWPWDQDHRLWNFTLKFFSTFLLWKQLRQIGGRTSVRLVTLTCGSWSEGQHDPYFTVQWFCLISWRLFDVWTSYFGIMSQYDLTCDLRINVGHYDLYFTVQWFCLISWRLFDVWTSYFGIMSQYHWMVDLKINVGHCDLYFIVQWFCLIFWRVFDAWTSYFEIMSQYDTTFDLKI